MTAPAVRLARAWALVPALVPGLAMLVVGRCRLRNPSLGWDEHATWAVARRTVPQILHQATHLDGVIAPYYLFVHAWTAIFGDSELALRLPSLLGVAIGVGLAGELGRRLFDPVVGLTGGLFLVAVPQLSRYAQEARPYGFEFLFATLATLLLYAALDRPSWSRWLRYGLAVTLLGGSHVIGLLVLAGHAVVVLSRGRPGRDRAVTRWLCTVPAAVAPVLPLVALGLAQRDRQLAWIGDLTLAQVLNAPGAIFLAPVVGLPLVGLALAARWPRPRPVRDLAALAVLPPALLLAASAPGASMWVPRYVIGVLAPVCLLAAVALRGPVARTVPIALRGSGARTVPVPRIALALLLVGAAAVPTQRAVRGPAARGGMDFRAATRIIVDRQRPADGILYGRVGTWSLRSGFDYQTRGRSRPRDVLLVRPAAEVGELEAGECADPAPCLGGADRIWYLGARRDDNALSDLGGRERAALDRGYRLARLWRLHLGTVALYERR